MIHFVEIGELNDPKDPNVLCDITETLCILTTGYNIMNGGNSVFFFFILLLLSLLLL